MLSLRREGSFERDSLPCNLRRERKAYPFFELDEDLFDVTPDLIVVFKSCLKALAEACVELSPCMCMAEAGLCRLICT